MRVDGRQEQAEPLFRGSLWSRLVKGFGANVIGHGINITSKILLVPLFLHAWGAEKYGEWLILSSFVAYLSLTDLGGQVYIVNRLTQAYARRDIALFRKVLHSGMVLFLFLPTATLVLFVLGVSAYPIGRALGVSQTPHSAVVVITALLAAQFLVALPQGILLGVYRAIGLLPTGVMLGNLLMLLQLAFTAAGLLLGAGMAAIAALQIAPYALIASVVMVDLQRRSHEFGVYSLREASYPLIKSFVKPSLHFFSIQLSQLLSNQGTVLVAGALLGSVHAVIFSVLRTIAHSIMQLLGAITHTAWPEITRLDAEGDGEGLRRLFRFALRTSLAGAYVCFVIFHFWAQDIVRLWLGEAFEYNQHLMDLALLYMLLLVFWTACSHVLMATNTHRTLAKIMPISSMLTLLAAYLGSQHFGLEGLIVGMIVADAVLPLWLVPRLLAAHQPVFTAGFFLGETLPCVIAVALTFLFPASWPVLVAVVIFWWTRTIANLRFTSL